MERNFKFPAYLLPNDRILIEGCFMPHMNILQATTKNKTEYNVFPILQGMSIRGYYESLCLIDLMDYPKLVPHMIGPVRDWWLNIQHKNQVFEWLLTKGISKTNAEYACHTTSKEAKEWYLKFLKDRGRLW